MNSSCSGNTISDLLCSMYTTTQAAIAQLLHDKMRTFRFSADLDTKYSTKIMSKLPD